MCSATASQMVSGWPSPFRSTISTAASSGEDVPSQPEMSASNDTAPPYLQSFKATEC
jgi:hypothetical protein